jgi:hypothetical protein
MTIKIWKLLLALWLLVSGLVVIANVNFPGLLIILAIIAIVTAILLIIDR